MKVFEWCYTLDNTLSEARRPTEAEKKVTPQNGPST